MSDNSGYVSPSFAPPQYDSSGYVTNMVAMGPENNPWTSLASQSMGNYNQASTAAAGIPGLQSNVGQQMSAMNAYGAATQAPAQQSAAYPTMKNDYALGSNGSGAASGDASARGNPWMLKGDALSR